MKKRIFSMIISLVMIISIIPVTAAITNDVKNLSNFIAPIEVISNKSGWIAISTRAELEAIADNLDGKYYLTSDIDLGGEEWIPIEMFSGDFDGQGYVIRNMTNTGKRESCGLFKTTINATMRNIGLEKVNVNINPEKVRLSGSYSFGSLISDASNYYIVAGDNTIIDNCYSMGEMNINFTDVLSSGDNDGEVSVGGLIGRGGKYISNCYNAIDISIKNKTDRRIRMDSIGGISGSSSEIINCYNAGDISIDNQGYVSVGGISSGGKLISNCYNKGDISIYNSWSCYIGGIAGISSKILLNCYNIGIVFARPYDDESARCSIGEIVSPASYYQASNSYSFCNEEGTIITNEMTINPLTLEQMQQQSSFVGFDFEDVWTIIDGVNNNMPVLRAFYIYPPLNCDTCEDSGEHCLDCCEIADCETCTPPKFNSGDVDGDDEVTIMDAVEILLYLAKLDSVIEEGNASWNAALIVSEDVPGIMDAVEILKLLAELPSVLG